MTSMPLKEAAELLVIPGEAGFRLWQAGGTILEGWVTAQKGDVDALLKIREGTDNWLGTGAKFMLPYFLGLQAQIELKFGEAGIALDLLNKAQVQVEATTERWFGSKSSACKVRHCFRSDRRRSM